MNQNGQPISPAKQRTILRASRLGFTVKRMALDNKLPETTIRSVLRGHTLPSKFDLKERRQYGLRQLATRLCKDATNLPSNHERLAQLRCIRMNFCDVFPEWRPQSNG